MRINNFEKFNESTEWKDDLFLTRDEKEVADVVEQEMLTAELSIIDESDEATYTKLVQASSNKGEVVLEITNHTLTKYDTPVEFIKWERLGADSTPIEICFVIKTVEKDKI